MSYADRARYAQFTLLWAFPATGSPAFLSLCFLVCIRSAFVSAFALHGSAGDKSGGFLGPL